MAIKEKHKRPSWDEYFLDIMDAVSKRSTCNRGRSAAVVVKGKRIMVTGYSGAPIGIAHCDEVGHELREVINEDGTKSQHCIRTTHAEQNAFAQAAKFGLSIDGGTVYLNMEPCYYCAKMLINTGIVRCVCRKRYHGGKRSREILKEAGVELVVLSNDLESYGEE